MDREELRKKLRSKIQEKRNPRKEETNNVKKDPKGTLLSMGIDDPSILNMAEDILKGKTNIESLKRTLCNEVSNTNDEDVPPS